MNYTSLENFKGTEYENYTEEEIFLKNERYIKATIRRKFSNLEYYMNKHMLEYDDLYAFGCEGLIKSIRQYDSSFNTKFSSFAINYIRGYISNRIKTDTMKYKTENDESVLSLDTPVGDDESGLLLDTIESNEYYLESINEVDNKMKETALEVLNGLENIDSELYVILSERIKGKDNVQIARILNKDKSSIGRRLKSKKALAFKAELLNKIRSEVV